MRVKHLITKDIEDGKRRLFFEVWNNVGPAVGGDLYIQIKPFLGKVLATLSATNMSMITPGRRRVYYFDLPSAQAKLFKRYEWAWKYGDRAEAGRGKSSGKFEKIR